jgi:polar amino acid transport system substrate-binding protein
MRKFFLGVAVFALIAGACASETEGGGTTGETDATGTTAAPATAAECADQRAGDFFADGQLTIATDNPAFQPWFAGTGTYGDWKAEPNSGTGNPASGKGFESDVAYQIADAMGFSKDQVTWVPVNFNLSYKPGPTDYDFYLGQVAYTEDRAQAVSFSDGYYELNQALVAVKGTPITKATSIADLKDYKLGAQVGTTSYNYIVDEIQPSTQPQVYDRSVDVIQALNNGQIDGYLADAPTAYVNVLIGQVTDGVVVGQFPNSGEYLGTTSSLDSPIVECVNLAIAEIEASGGLDAAKEKWLAALDYQELS